MPLLHLSQLDSLEHEAIHIIREAAARALISALATKLVPDAQGRARLVLEARRHLVKDIIKSKESRSLQAALRQEFAEEIDLLHGDPAFVKVDDPPFENLQERKVDHILIRHPYGPGYRLIKLDDL